MMHAILLIASFIAIRLLAPGARIPNPFASDDASRVFFTSNAHAIRVGDFLQLASAMCLAALAAVMSAVQKARNTRSIGWTLTLAGGTGAATFLVLTSLCSWALAAPLATDPGTAFHTLQFLPFLMGGPGWAGFFSMFVAGIAISGTDELPKWAVLSGYCLSVVAGLATLVLLTIDAAPCLPIARFLGFVWLIAVTWLLSYGRGQSSSVGGK
jgi:hypothetical protein